MAITHYIREEAVSVSSCVEDDGAIRVRFIGGSDE